MHWLFSSGNSDFVCSLSQEVEASPNIFWDWTRVGGQKYLPDGIGQRRLIFLGNLEHLLQKQWPEFLFQESPELFDSFVELEVVGNV